MTGTTERREVWLRGNVRPVAGVAVVVALAISVALVALSAGGAQASLAWAVAGGGAAVLTALTALGLAAARPRLTRQGDALEIRLAPTAVERVPLGVVECVFRGTEAIADRGGGEARFRVGTLVIRFAERAHEWQVRNTFAPWGTWSDGHAVIDGRWCEPLSREVVERIAAALVDAKRQAAARPGA